MMSDQAIDDCLPHLRDCIRRQGATRGQSSSEGACSDTSCSSVMLCAAFRILYSAALRTPRWARTEHSDSDEHYWALSPKDFISVERLPGKFSTFRRWIGPPHFRKNPRQTGLVRDDFPVFHVSMARFSLTEFAPGDFGNRLSYIEAGK